MATSTFSCSPIQSTDAEWRAWIAAVKTAIDATSMWTITADTGQIDVTTSTKPVSTNADRGFLMYKHAPGGGLPDIYMYVGFGAGSAVTTPRLNIRFGFGSTGAGVLTGIITNGTSNPWSFTATSTSCVSYMSWDSTAGRWWLLFAADHPSGVTQPLLVLYERTRNSAGAATALGASICLNQSGNRNTYSGASGAQILDTTNLGGGNPGSTILVGADYYYASTWAHTCHGAMLSVLGCATADLPSLATVSVTHYGAARTFLGTMMTSLLMGNAGYRVGLLYE